MGVATLVLRISSQLDSHKSANNMSPCAAKPEHLPLPLVVSRQCHAPLGSPLTDKSSFFTSSTSISPTQWSRIFTFPQSNVAIKRIPTCVTDIGQDERSRSPVLDVSGFIQQSFILGGYSIVHELQHVSQSTDIEIGRKGGTRTRRWGSRGIFGDTCQCEI